MQKYRKKPVVIEALKWTGNNFEDMESFISVDFGYQLKEDNTTVVIIPTLEGFMEGSIGDYIIKGIRGEFYPCKPDIFEDTHELVIE